MPIPDHVLGCTTVVSPDGGRRVDELVRRAAHACPAVRVSDAGEGGITREVLEQVSGAGDPRTRMIGEALVRHLHAFVREVEPTEAEWRRGIDFLTATGQTCSATRQEFILLSDVLGVSMLVDAINHRDPGGTTETTVLGPFHVASPAFENGADIRGHLAGTAMIVEGTVADQAGVPIAGATVDVWHSDEDGFYDLQKLDDAHGLAGRGSFRTDARGAFHFWTVRPAAYPIPDDGPVGRLLAAQGRHPYRPEHIHFMIGAPGRRTLVTHLFADSSDYLASDVVFGVKASLICRYETMDGGVAPDGRPMVGDWVRLRHDFVLAEATGDRRPA